VVALRIAEGQSVVQLISAWAPESDGNATAAYIQNVKAWAEIPDETVPLWNFIGASE
jgi:recombinational DNA repair protein RecR